MHKNIFRTGLPVAVFVLTMIGGVSAQPDSLIPENAELQKTEYSVEDLLGWTRRGQGYVNDFRGSAVQMAEQEGSKGVILKSQKSFGTKTVVRYKVFTHNPGTVLVAMLSASNSADSSKLTIPVKDRGGVSFWTSKPSVYFFAFHNAAHMKKPFLARLDQGEKVMSANAEKQVMSTGRWYDVEVGRWSDRLWLKINDQVLVDATDSDPASGGHVVLRIRGTGIQQANCMIRDFRILTPEN